MKKILILLFSLFIFSGSCFAETVYFNVKTSKYHKPTCQYAQKCTKNCIKIEKKEAKARGGVPCKVCGG